MRSRTKSWTSPCSSASDFTFWKSGKVFGPPGQGHRNMRSLSSVCFGSFHFFCSCATCSLSAGWPCGWSCAEVIRGRGFPRHLFEEEASSQACWFQDCWFQDCQLCQSAIPRSHSQKRTRKNNKEFGFAQFDFINEQKKITSAILACACYYYSAELSIL